jgi:glucosamine--fructose-6-phosphate aminotransferase (isomerizing)
MAPAKPALERSAVTRIASFIEEQPDVVRRVFGEVPGRVREIAGEVPGRPRAVALVGSGTSRHALTAAQRFLERRLACPVSVLGPMEFMGEPPVWAGPGALAVLLSQSGASTTTAEAVAVARDRGMATLILTAEADSAVGTAGGPVVVMPIDAEPVGPKTKGYAGSLATLLALGLVLGGDGEPGAAVLREVDAICEAMAAGMRRWAAAAAELASRYARTPYIMIAAHGRHLGTACEGALKITEMSGIPAAAFDTEEALHGRLHALDAGTPALFIARVGAEADLARSTAVTLAELGIPHHVLAVGGPGDGLDVALPALAAVPELDLLSAVVPLQWLARALAVARGMVPEAMRYPGLSARLGIKTPAGAE